MDINLLSVAITGMFSVPAPVDTFADVLARLRQKTDGTDATIVPLALESVRPAAKPASEMIREAA